MARKLALFVFNGDPMCFIHVLLNARDLADKGHEPHVVIEGSAVRIVGEVAAREHPLHQLYADVKSRSLIDGVCRACSAKLGATADVEAEGLPFLDDMNGHPGMARYLEAGFELITF